MLFIVAICLLASQAFGAICHNVADLSLSAPNLLSESANYRMQWKIMGSELFVTLSASSASVKWLGFGFPEQTSAGMAGSDVVIVRFNSADGGAIAEDRHVQWRSFPFYPVGDAATFTFGETSVPTSPTFFPARDCENNGTDDWIVITSSKTDECMLVTMKRAFQTEDHSDRPVPVGLDKYFWAFGTTTAITYHGGANRGVESEVFRPELAPVYEQASLVGTISRTFLFEDYEIPVQETTYSCKAFMLNNSLDFTQGKQYDIVGFEPIIHPATKPHVHHIVVFMCPGNAPIPTRIGQSECGNAQMEQCYSMLFTWGVGAGPLYFPVDVGARVGERTGHFNTSYALYMQMHYTNLEGLTDLVDQSGVRVFFDTSLKKHQMGTLMLGIPGLQWEPLQGNTPETHRQTTCPSGCTYYFKERVTVFSSLLHMHEFGKKIWTVQYDINGTFKRITNRIDFWSFGNQNLKPVNFTVEPGDRLQTHCVYDTTKWPLTVHFAEETFTEMCFDIITYFPAQFSPDPNSRDSPFFNCGGYYNETDDKTRTVCTNRQLSDSYIAQAHANNWWPNEIKNKFVQIEEPESLQSSSVTAFAKNVESSSLCSVVPSEPAVPPQDPQYEFQLNELGGNTFSWKRTSSKTLKAQVEGPPDSWLAWGLAASGNTGNKMIGSVVIIGMPSTDSMAQGQACGVFRLTGFSLNQMQRIPAPNGLISCTYETTATKSVLTFEASHLGDLEFKGFRDGGRLLQQDSSMTDAITAQGPSNAFGQHSNQAAFNVDLLTSFSSSSNNNDVKVIHAVFMVLGFVVFTGLGAVAAAGKTLLHSNWFMAHKVFVAFAVISCAIGLGVIVPKVAVPMRTSHHVLGVVAIGLMLVQPLLGVIRPHLPSKAGEAKSSKRVVWELVHKNNGRLIFVLGVVNSFLGVVQHGSGLSPPISSPSTVQGIFFAFVGSFGLVLVTMWVWIKLRAGGHQKASTTVVDDEKQHHAVVAGKV